MTDTQDKPWKISQEDFDRLLSPQICLGGPWYFVETFDWTNLHNTPFWFMDVLFVAYQNSLAPKLVNPELTYQDQMIWLDPNEDKYMFVLSGWLDPEKDDLNWSRHVLKSLVELIFRDLDKPVQCHVVIWNENEFGYNDE